MKVFDAHVHIGLSDFCINDNTDFGVKLNNNYSDFIKIMDDNNIDKSIILPIPHKDFDSYKSNEYLLSAYNSFPNRFSPFCRIDKKLEENFKKGFMGAKIHFVYEETEIKQIKNELLFLESIDVPLIVHPLFKDKVKQIESLLKIVPNLKIILAHMGRGHIYTDEGILDNAVALKKYDNVFFETSTVGNAESIKSVYKILGEDRIIFGSDYPFGKSWFRDEKKYTYNDEITLFDNIGLSAKSIEKILYLNTFNLLEIGKKSTRVSVRKIIKKDFEQVINIFESLSTIDKKFLALEPKISLIKQNIKDERHCYVATIDNKIVGFMRESGRPEGYSLLEEIVVHPDYRKRGIALKILKYYHRIFSKTLAKTNAKNNAIIKLLMSNGYYTENPDAKRIINWKRCEE